MGFLPRKSTISLLLLLVMFWPASDAAGQDIRGDTTLSGINNTLSNGRLLRGGGGSGLPGSTSAGSPTGTGYVDMRAAAASSVQRAPGVSSPNFLGTGEMGDSTAMLVPFSRSRSASSFAGPVFNGVGHVFPPMSPGFVTESTSRIIQENRNLLRKESFHHRLFLPLEGGAVRDELTNLSLTNSRQSSEADIRPTTPRKTHAERLVARMAAIRARYLKSGWESMKAGAYREAMDQFESAVNLDRKDPEAHSGRILAALADRRFETAVAYLRTQLNHCDDAFAFQVSLAEILPTAEFGRSMLEYLSAMADANNSDSDSMALNVFLLWLDGRDSMARSTADDLQRLHRTSEFSGLADIIREAIDAKSATEPDTWAALRG
jgi:hypothetical protein